MDHHFPIELLLKYRNRLIEEQLKGGAALDCRIEIEIADVDAAISWLYLQFPVSDIDWQRGHYQPNRRRSRNLLIDVVVGALGGISLLILLLLICEYHCPNLLSR